MRRTRKQTRRRPDTVDYRTNRRIRVREVRLIDHNGVNHGIVSTDEAQRLAREAELDLVEVAPNAKPPVCRIMDYGKFAYEQNKKLRDAQKRQTKIEVKTLKLTPRTDPYHISIQVKKAREWLGEGKKVRFQVKFKARERDYPEIGQKALEEIAEELQDVSEIEQQPTMEGWNMSLMLVPST